jgi:hypothetical protein
MTLIHHDATERGFRALRAWIVVLWLWVVLRQPVNDLHELPEVAFVPPEIFQHLFPDDGGWLLRPMVLDALQVGSLLCLVLTLVTRVAPATGILAAGFVTLHQGLTRSFHYVHHAQLALLYALYVVVLFQLSLSLSRSRRSQGSAPNTALGAGLNLWTLPFLGVLGVLCLTYSFTGVYRVAHGGPELFWSDSLEFWLADRALVFGAPWRALLTDLPGTWEFLNVGFALVTCFETLAPLTLAWRPFRWAFIVVIGAFHVLSFGLMGIPFWENLLLFPLFVDRVPFRSALPGGRGAGGAAVPAAPP